MSLEADYVNKLEDRTTTELKQRFSSFKAKEVPKESVSQEQQQIDSVQNDGQEATDIFSAPNFKPKKGMETPEETEGKTSKVIKDIGRGATEIDEALFKGIVDAGNEMINLADKLGYNLVKGLTPKKYEKYLGDPNQNQNLVQKMVKDTGLYPELESEIGEFVSNIAQFMTGMAALPGAKAIKGAGKAIEGVKKAYKFVKPALADMISFGENEDRLSDMLNQVVPDGSLAKSVTEWMAGDEDDSLLEAKLKQGAEGILTDMGISVVGKAAKTLRAAKKARVATNVVPTVEQQLASGAKVTDFSKIGDLNSPDLIIKKKIATAMKETEGLAKGAKPVTDDVVEINFARINAPEDVQKAMQEYANANASSIKKAVRETVTDIDSIEKADAQTAFTDLLMRKSGQPLNKEQTVAARLFYNDVTKKLMDTAEVAAKEPDNAVAQYNFRKMLAVQHATQKELMGARAEAGRALQAWNVEVGMPKEMSDQIETLLSVNGGGKEVSSELAKSILNVRDNPEAIMTVVNGGWKSRTLDAVLELRTKGLLSSGKTHMKNVLSNTAYAGKSVVDRFYASALNPEAISRKETLVYASNMMRSLKEALINAKEAFKTGGATAKGEVSYTRRASAEFLDPNSKLPSFLRKALDGYSSGIDYLSVKGLSAEDGFFKTILHNAEKGALLTRKGIGQGLSGKELDDYIKLGMTQYDEAIEAEARQFALTHTFNNSLTGWEKSFADTVYKHRGLRFSIIFLKAPINLFNEGIKNSPLAPLSEAYRKDIAAGGARKALAQAKMQTGSLLWITTVDAALSGDISGAGPTDKSIRQAWMRKGWRPYSIRIGNKWISYQGLEPFSFLLGTASSFSETVSAYDMYGLDDDKMNTLNNVVSSAILALSQEAFNKSYLTGFSDIMQTLSPAFSGEADVAAKNLLQSGLTSFIPTAEKDLRKAWDNKKRYAYDMLDSLKNETIGQSNDLPVKRDMWGDELKYKDGHKASDIMMQFVSPFNVVAVNENPIDNEIIRLNAPINTPSTNQNFTIGGISAKVNMRDYPEAYSRFLQLSGNELKLRQFEGMGCKDYLNAVVTGKSRISLRYDRLPDDRKTEMLSNIIKVYREQAKQEVYQGYTDLYNEVNKQIQTKYNEMTGGQ